jgi:hypothetical protein
MWSETNSARSSRGGAGGGWRHKGAHCQDSIYDSRFAYCVRFDMTSGQRSIICGVCGRLPWRSPMRLLHPRRCLHWYERLPRRPDIPRRSCPPRQFDRHTQPLRVHAASPLLQKPLPARGQSRPEAETCDMYPTRQMRTSRPWYTRPLILVPERDATGARWAIWRPAMRQDSDPSDPRSLSLKTPPRALCATYESRDPKPTHRHRSQSGGRDAGGPNACPLPVRPAGGQGRGRARETGRLRVNGSRVSSSIQS